MKFPSLFRTPTNKRFNFEPRYYDPVKEEIARRTARIEREMTQEQTNNYRTNISNAFARKPRQSNKTGLIQFSLIAILFCGIFGWLFYGDIVLYIILGVMAIYLVIRLRTLFKFR